MLKNRIHLGERAAHPRVAAHSAAALFDAEGIDWPVSGDETLLAYGYGGRDGATPSIWARSGGADHDTHTYAERGTNNG